MQIIHIPCCLDHILGYTTLKIVGPTYICKLKVLIVFSQGHVLSDGEPIQDVGFLLFSKSVTQKVRKSESDKDMTCLHNDIIKPCLQFVSWALRLDLT